MDYNRIEETLNYILGNGIKKGRNIMYHCPFCGFSKRKRPHFGVNLEKGVFGCFRCGMSGKVFNLIKNFIPSFEIKSTQLSNATIEDINKYTKLNIEIINKKDLIPKRYKDYINCRLLSFDKFWNTIIFHDLDFFISKDGWLVTRSLLENYLSMRLLDDNKQINKRIIRISNPIETDLFIYKINSSNDDFANIFIFEGIFDMLTHLIHMNKNLVNSYYIILNGRVISNNIKIGIDKYIIEKNKNIFIFKDSDVKVVEIMKYINKYFMNDNVYICYFTESKDLNHSFISKDLKDFRIRRVWR